MGEGLLYARTTTENILLDEQGRLVCLLNGDLPEVCREGKFVLRDYHTMQQVYVKNPLRDIAVLYNGNSLFFDVPPLLEDGRTLVPLRAIFEAMEAEVSWDDRTKTVYAKRGETHIVLPVGAPSFTKNGTEILLDVPAKIEKGRTLIPLRAVADALGCKVDWQGETRTVLLFS
ncbi:MAG: copper amine oxidase N-terminal domain-containing protein [Ruminococcaceae bacterium]|nr:copper amine oxidase N-terminal domain-containing protein [Oscillospiraceae bacterium]